MRSEATARNLSDDPRARNESELIEAMGKFFANPYGFVMFAYHDYWEEVRKTDPTAGPDKWQTEVLLEIGKQVEARIKGESPETAIMIAVRSGHGPGKTALSAWINHWFISTRPHPQSVTTANTRTQLETKTWRELAVWWKRSVHRHWFNWTFTKFYNVAHPETWFAAGIPWTREKAEAFAGTHEKHVLYIFDEASLIPDEIWETAQGAMTTPGVMWFVFGNPTRNTGRFKECWGKFRHRWKGFQVDSRTAKMTNKAELEQWIEDYGEDSDFVRVRVTGDFPRASSLQFIPEDLIKLAFERHVSVDPAAFRDAPIILGVDVAREGDDQTVIAARQGIYVHPQIQKFRIPDLMRVASLVAEAIRKWTPAATCIDAIGLGAGVVDRLRQLGYSIVSVKASETAIDDRKYTNRRAELWAGYKTWLEEGGCLPEDDELRQDSIGIEYGYDAKERLVMEKKPDMKRRGLASPDIAEAILQTFGVRLGPSPIESWGDRRPKAETEYDPFSEMYDPIM